MTTSAGYSDKPLAVKLGIKPGQRIALLYCGCFETRSFCRQENSWSQTEQSINAPHDYMALLGALPEDVTVTTTLTDGCDLIHLFVVSRAELEASYPQLRRSLVQNGAIWISWPKRGSKTPSDLNENAVRAVGLANRMVDVKVAAVDATWSALKFVIRLAERGK